MNEQEIKLPEIDHELLAGYGELWKAIVAWEEKGQDRIDEAERVDEIVKSMMNAHARLAVQMNQQCPELNTTERRPFDLESAKRGDPLVTRDRRSARFVAHVEGAANYSVVAYIEGDNIVETYTEEGLLLDEEAATNADLFMAPKPKRTVWANTYYHDTEQRALAMSGGAALVAVPVQIDA